MDEHEKDKKPRRFDVVDALYWGGGALITGAFAMSNLAGGMVVAGLFCLVGAWLIDRSGGGGEDA